MTLREYRKSKCLTLSQAAKEFGVSYARFSQIELNWPHVSIETMASLCVNFDAKITIKGLQNVQIEPEESTQKLAK